MSNIILIWIKIRGIEENNFEIYVIENDNIFEESISIDDLLLLNNCFYPFINKDQHKKKIFEQIIALLQNKWKELKINDIMPDIIFERKNNLIISGIYEPRE